jgi:hypothetical protein
MAAEQAGSQPVVDGGDPVRTDDFAVPVRSTRSRFPS